MPFNYEGALDVFFLVFLIFFLQKENEEKISNIVLDQPLGESNPFSLREG
jgi:hypothetical protein